MQVISGSVRELCGLLGPLRVTMRAVAWLSPAQSGSVLTAAAVSVALISNLLADRLPHIPARMGHRRSRNEEVVSMVKRLVGNIGRASFVTLGSIASGVAVAALG